MVLRVLPRREHLMKRSETRPVMKMVMISGRGDSGGKEFSEELLPLTAFRNVHNSFDSSTTGKPMRSFATERVSLDSV
jgi:hypothetical protein